MRWPNIAPIYRNSNTKNPNKFRQAIAWMALDDVGRSFSEISTKNICTQPLVLGVNVNLELGNVDLRGPTRPISESNQLMSESCTISWKVKRGSQGVACGLMLARCRSGNGGARNGRLPCWTHGVDPDDEILGHRLKLGIKFQWGKAWCFPVQFLSNCDGQKSRNA